MGKPRVYLPACIRQALDETGLDWTVDRSKRHQLIRVRGHLVGILPGDGGDEKGHGNRNVIASIRRKAKELKYAGS